MLNVQNISFDFDENKRGLKDVSCKFESGKRYALLGRSGSGKSTLAKLIKGIYQPTKGSISIDQKELDELSCLTYVGYIHQDPQSQILCNQVFEEVAFGLKNLGLSLEEVNAKTNAALKSCGIAHLSHSTIEQLSGGQIALVAIAGILAMEPEVLILDEIKGQLDYRCRHTIDMLLDTYVKSGHIVIEISHLMSDVLLADEVVVLHKRELIYKGKTEDFVHAIPQEIRYSLDGNFLINYLKIHTLAEARELLKRRNRPHGVFGVIQGSSEPPERLDLALEGISCYADNKIILSEITSSIKSGNVTLITGVSGSGKTTLLHCLCNLLPFEGKIFFKYKQLERKHIAASFQRPEDQFFNPTLKEDILFSLMHTTNDISSEQELSKQAERIAYQLGLTGLLPSNPFELSGGQKRLGALAISLIQDKEIYLLDEPTNGLDASSIQKLQALIATLKSHGKTVVVISHDLDLWIEKVDQIILMKDGTILSRFAADKAHERMADFLNAGLSIPLQLLEDKEVAHAQ